MKATKDGRQWQQYVPSSQKGFTGTRRTANCSGTHQCIRRHCSFLKKYDPIFKKWTEEPLYAL
jgi:hypothetical protein